MPASLVSSKQPAVFVTESDYETLSSLAAEFRTPGAALLRDELARAKVVKDASARGPFVRLGSTVTYRDLLSGRSRTVTVVEPSQAQVDENRVSVIAPAGAALIGLRPGDTFSWSVEDRPRVLVVDRVAGPG